MRARRESMAGDARVPDDADETARLVGAEIVVALLSALTFGLLGRD